MEGGEREGEGRGSEYQTIDSGPQRVFLYLLVTFITHAQKKKPQTPHSEKKRFLQTPDSPVLATLVTFYNGYSLVKCVSITRRTSLII